MLLAPAQQTTSLSRFLERCQAPHPPVPLSPQGCPDMAQMGSVLRSMYNTTRTATTLVPPYVTEFFYTRLFNYVVIVMVATNSISTKEPVHIAKKTHQPPLHALTHIQSGGGQEHDSAI